MLSFQRILSINFLLCFVLGAIPLTQASIPTLDCKTLIKRHPLPYTDGRVAYFCERAFMACLLEKAVQLSQRNLESEVDPKKKADETKKLEDLLARNRFKRDDDLNACQFMFNFFKDPENTFRIFEEGL